MDIDTLTYAKLSIQNALLGAVVPELRAVYLDIDEKARKLFISFFYDGEVTDELFDLASVVSTEVDVPSCDELEEKIERLDFPKEIPNQGHLVYLRKE